MIPLEIWRKSCCSEVVCYITMDAQQKSIANPSLLGWCELKARSSLSDDEFAVLPGWCFERSAVMQLHKVRCKINEPAGRMLLNSLLGAVHQGTTLPHIHPHHHHCLEGWLR